MEEPVWCEEGRALFLEAISCCVQADEDRSVPALTNRQIIGELCSSCFRQGWKPELSDMEERLERWNWRGAQSRLQEFCNQGEQMSETP